MPRTPSPAADSGLPKDQTNSCPVAKTARELKRVVDLYCKLEGYDGDPEYVPSADDRRLAKLLNDRKEFLEVQTSQLIARSGLGAILQIQMIMNDAEVIASWVPEDSRAASMCADLIKSIERMSYSLVAFIEAATSAKAEDAACNFYMGRDANPHLRIKEALETLKEAVHG